MLFIFTLVHLLKISNQSNTFLPYAPISPTHIVFDFTAETMSPTDSQRSGSHGAAIRVAGPPSTVEPGSSTTSSVLRPSDSVSASGQETPQMSPQVQPRSLSFAYDVHNLSLSPPVVVSPNLPSSPSFSAISSSSEFVVRPSHPQALGLDSFPTPSISRPETPFSSISSISGAPESPYEFPSPRLAHLAIPSSHSPSQDISPNSTTNRTLSAVNSHRCLALPTALPIAQLNRSTVHPTLLALIDPDYENLWLANLGDCQAGLFFLLKLHLTGFG